jgi:hypothetical protein
MTEGKDLRFCPYCFLIQFDMAAIEGPSVFCEVCGIDVLVEELVKTV